MNETRNLPLVQDIILDMTESQLPVVYANQYDTSGRTVNCHIQDQGVDFDCTGYTVQLWLKKSNDYALSRTIGVDGFGSVSGNIVTFPIQKELTMVHGRQETKLVFIKVDEYINSSPFYLRVNKSNVDNDDVMDSDDYKTFHDEYLELKGLVSDSLSAESIYMNDGTDLQTKMNSVDAEIDTKIDSVKIGTTECKSGTTVTLPVYTKDETDSTFGADIALTIDTSTYKMTLELKDNKGQLLSSKEIDFPIESMVVNANYSNGTLTLTLQNGNTLDVDISSIISGLVPDTRTIAGIDLKDNITATELRTALNVASGANNYTHPDSGVTAGTYRSVTVNKQGHVTAGSNPTLTVAQGGTGATTANAAANMFIKSLDGGTEVPLDTSNIIIQGGTGYTDKYYLKPFSLIWNYIKSKADSIYLKLSGGTLDKGATITLQRTDDDRKTTISAGSVKFTNPTGNWATGLWYNTPSNTGTGSIGAYGAGDTLSYFYIGANYDNPTLKIVPSGKSTFTGNVNAPSYNVNDKASISYNSTTESIDFTFL